MAEALDYSTGRSGAASMGTVIIAKPSRDYRWRRYALVLVIFGWGIWSIYDGFYNFPRENAEFKQKYPMAVKEPHPGLDVPLNRDLGIIMPPLSILFLGWIFYNSRGEYRFDGQTLDVPGHPGVALTSIRKIDRARWDRKGIAYVYYQKSGSSDLAKLRLDDFIYDRLPTDAIYKQLEETLDPAKAFVPPVIVPSTT